MKIILPRVSKSRLIQKNKQMDIQLGTRVMVVIAQLELDNSDSIALNVIILRIVRSATRKTQSTYTNLKGKKQELTWLLQKTAQH